MALSCDSLNNLQTIKVYGKVTKIVGLVIEGYCPNSAVGSLCKITATDNNQSIFAEVVGFRDSYALLMPLGDIRGLGPGSRIRVIKNSATIKVGSNLLGRVIDAMETPQDNLPAPVLSEEMSLYANPPGPMSRKNIAEPMDLGIRAINGLMTCGMGQRMGIMAGSGIGKSVLLGMISKYARADVNVIALIG